MALIYGIIGSDTKNGTAENDTIYGWAIGGSDSSPSGNDILYGNAGNDLLYGGTDNDYLDGGTGNDYLNGGRGNDTLKGGAGNDTYVVGSISDIVTENLDQGIDTVNSYISWVLGNNLENLTLKDSSTISGTGNALNNVIIGNTAKNSLYGQAGDDTLDGGLGIDTLVGGTGSDTYIVDSTTDTIIEYPNNPEVDEDYDAVDNVNSSVSFTIGNYLENLTLTGNSGSIGTGNALNNTLSGNTANNSLYTQAGNDTLDGALGIDSLYGGTGDDTYIVDSITDSITENALEGSDTIQSSVSYTLGNNLERLVLKGYALLGSGGLTGIGNALDNNIDAMTGNNSLYGGDGNDRIAAGVDSSLGNDILDGGAGNDTLSGANGNDYLDGGSGNDFLTGDYYNPLTGYSDTLIGGTGNDTLLGGVGSDLLTGGAGQDNFRFDFTSEGIDTITDFVVADDTIGIYGGLPDYVHGFGGGLTKGTTITTAQFALGLAATDPSDRFIYNKNSGSLFFDADGTGAGAQVQLASLATGLAMTSTDIFIVG